MHLLAQLLILHAGTKCGGVFFGQKFLVEGLVIIVIAGERLILLLDARTHGGVGVGGQLADILFLERGKPGILFVQHILGFSELSAEKLGDDVDYLSARAQVFIHD